jgi:hypothetical protein
MCINYIYDINGIFRGFEIRGNIPERQRKCRRGAENQSKMNRILKKCNLY